MLFVHELEEVDVAVEVFIGNGGCCYEHGAGHDDRLDAFANKFAGSLSDRLLPLAEGAEVLQMLIIPLRSLPCLNHG